MKTNVTYTVFIFLIWKIGISQSTLITPGNNQPNINAISSNSGVLVPRVSLTPNLASPSPTTSPQEGLMVYNSGALQPRGFYFWTGTAWSSLGVAISSLSATSPLSISTNTIKINAGTTIGQLITWDGTNWLNTNPKSPSVITNMQPYLALNYCIALQGVFPSRAGIEPFIGEIGLFAFNFTPRGWAMCNGQLLPISQNTALFSLLGTTYGGDGRTTFALPDLRGRTAIHSGQGPGLSNYPQGERAGLESNPLSDKY